MVKNVHGEQRAVIFLDVWVSIHLLLLPGLHIISLVAYFINYLGVG